jgi:uncharacterized protein (DUF1697 family)
MPRYVALLRGINLGPTNRIPMPALREALAGAGFEDVKTYVASGNVVLASRAKPETVRRKVEQVIEDHFGLKIPVVVRTRAELEAIVKRNPLAKVAAEPKRYQVTFLDELAAPEERVVAAGREVYAWHPSGVARSKLWARLAAKNLGVTGTSRNWTTVEALLELLRA